MDNSTLAAAGTSAAGANECEEQILVLQLNGVLDFEAVKKAAQIGAIRVRNASTDAPLVQVMKKKISICSQYLFRSGLHFTQRNGCKPLAPI